MIQEEKLKLVRKYKKESAVLMRRMTRRKFKRKHFRQLGPRKNSTIARNMVDAIRLVSIALNARKAIAMPLAKPRPQFPSGGIAIVGERGEELVLNHKQL